jgi:hypothetical protein
MKLLLICLIGLKLSHADETQSFSSHQMHECRHYETQFKKVVTAGNAYDKAGEHTKANAYKVKAVEFMKKLQSCDQSYLGIDKSFLEKTIKLAEEEIKAYEAKDSQP